MTEMGGLNTALSGLQADQVALDAISQNIANANTTGYVKTTVQLASVPIAGVGSGVQVTGLAQISDPTLASDSTAATGQSAYASANAATLSSIENSFPEPSTTGLSSQLSSLWSDIDAAGNAAGSSSSASALSTVVSAANTVAGTLRSTASALQQISDNAQSSSASLIQRDNSLLKQVAALNGRIAAASQTPQGPGGLTEQRNQAVSQLASDLGVTVRDQPNGSQSLYLGGVSLVQGTNTGQLSMSTGSPAQVLVTNGSAPGVAAASVGGGQGGTLGAEVDAMNSVVSTYQTQLNQVAGALATALHTTLSVSFVGGGSSGAPAAASAQLFTTDGTTTTAATIAVDPSVLSSPSLLGFSSSATASDGSLAQQLAESATTAASNANSLFSLTGTSGPTTVASPDTVWQQLVGLVGTASSQATTQATVAATAASNASSQLQSVTGVDQNEELTTMLQIQSAYQASAKVLSTINDTLQSLLAAI